MNINTDKIEQENEVKLDELEKNLHEKVTIAIVGKVSSGKSSLLNAIFNRNKNNPLAEVGAVSGVTTKVKTFELGKQVQILDCPGLGDVILENSAETGKALFDIDVGILVISESADISQKQNYDLLKEHCKKVFVVLNKIDDYDRRKSALPKVIEQWKEALGLEESEEIFQTCAFGYDPDTNIEHELDIRGVDELRNAIFLFLEKYGKNLILAREIEKKSTLAKRVIYSALVAVGAEAFIPGSTLYITTTQAAAIMGIHYIYTDEVLSKKAALAIIPVFISQSVGSNLFIFAKSFLPPTGILDVTAAGIAIIVTLAMLSAINWVYENGYSLDDTDKLKEQFQKFKSLLEDIGIKEISKIVLSGNLKGIMDLINKLVK